ncbi:MBL fold metallo-hydrolase [Thermodesulfobacteriota bacterium]
MKPSFLPRLVNEPFSDPGLFILFKYRRRALMFDLGDIRTLSAREILKLTHVFVTHSHMDHFIGFDTLLRTSLGREKTLGLFGPSGFFKNIDGKLAGYTWNLVDEFQAELKLEVSEVLPHGIITRKYNCRDKFILQDAEINKPFAGVLLEEPSFSIRAEILDHRIPCLALSLQENMHINIVKERLKDLEIPVGPWINVFKRKIYEKSDPEGKINISWELEGRHIQRSFKLADLIEMIAVITSGQKFTYITDAIATPDNCRRIIRLAKDSDIIFIEAPFMDKDKKIATKKFHLTAREAGELAAMAGAKSLRLFHFSRRYHGNGHKLEKEAREAYLSYLGGGKGV